MIPLRRRSGSALVIVLGFLSFMVVSAVAFAVYMRTERLATSGFHRSAAVRQMVKAGVANAIAQLDYAVGDDPFPKTAEDFYRNSSIASVNPINRFDDFVFSPIRTETTEVETARPRVIPLEGLAYLPPAIVNEVRLSSRYTRTAKWQNFDYDLGRFSYIAVDVSDFFDINKVRFGTQRNTGPGGRVSLAYLFQKEDGTGLDTGVSGTKLANLDKFVETRGGKESNVPFVSLADFNVALYLKDKTGDALGIYSPFYRYLATGTMRGFYNEDAYNVNDPYIKRAARMLFVTDSWHQPTNKSDVIDLANKEDQPFKKEAFSSADRKSILDIDGSGVGNAYTKRLEKDLCFTSVANLYDYLDDNSVPLSLAIPNVERVPMVAVVNGTDFAKGLQFTLKGQTDEGVPFNAGGQQGQGQSYIKKTTIFKLEPNFTQRRLKLVCMYPFKGPVKRSGEKSSKNYRVQVIAKVFFSESAQNGGGMSGRCFASTGITPLAADWNNKGARVDNNCITLVSEMQKLDLEQTILDDDSTVYDLLVEMPVNQLKAEIEKEPSPLELLRVVKLVQQSALGNETPVTGNFNGKDYPNVSSFNILPFVAKQEPTYEAPVADVDGRRESDKEIAAASAKCWGAVLTPHVAFWARVVDDEGNTVDLAPASINDDKLNGKTKVGHSMMYSDGSQYTPMLVASGKTIVFSDAQEQKVQLEGGQEQLPVFDGSPASFMAIDPRFNHSPEDFIVKSNDIGKDDYLDELDSLLGKEGRDADVFMFASDQEYLQSVGELSFLPRLGELGDSSDGLYAKCVTPIAFKTSFNEMKPEQCHKNSFWRTYPLYRQNGDDDLADDAYIFKYFSTAIEAGDMVIDSDVNGFKVSPYASTEKVRLAVTANTPHSFWASSTNTSLSAGNNPPPCFSGGQPKAIDQCLKYCFNEVSDNVGPMLAWEDVTNMTARVFDTMREDALDGKDWETSLASMNWYPDPFNPKKIFGDQAGNNAYVLRGRSEGLHSVDRKTLYSFWHDSMANRQQLFLVFVRVEAIPVGASDETEEENSVQSYGGRAVALVWRDPNKSASAEKIVWHDTMGEPGVCDSRRAETLYAPHRTRILFYHQFD